MSSNAPKTKLLLLGAGELGTAFLKHLSLLESIHITLGIRSPSKYTHLTTSYPSLSILSVDLSSPSASLSETFSTFDIVVSATGFGAAPTTVLKLAHEVLEAGRIKKVKEGRELWYFPWQWGVDYDVIGDGHGLMPLFGAQKDVRNLLREYGEKSNVVWTIVSTGIFMSFLFESFWGIVDRRKESDGEVVVRCLRDWDHGVTVTDVDDIGRVLARIVNGDVEAKRRVLYTAGDTVSYGQLAESVRRVTGKRVEKETWSIEYLGSELKADPTNDIKKYRLVFARDGVRWSKEKTVNHQLGMSMMDVETYTSKLFGHENTAQ
ncbi:hypothetical protein yc1106_08935 [Curvularia clavata]|uniref:NmrA-like domain-containing protein n=1 Tax=Curvularia clavata TaxID=95742 RepID=A0A9Q8ZGH5_CURCL|nr:hypothetical protein yc1106_08935 [Curvularia clavata]